MHGKMNMNYKEFTDYVIENFIEVLGEHIDVAGVALKKETVNKDNIGEVDALKVEFPNEDVVPITYINDMFKTYQVYMDGSQQEIEAAQKVIGKYAGSLVQRMPELKKGASILIKNGTVNNFVLDNLANLHMRIIGYENNKEMLRDYPHRRFLDMAVTYRISLSQNSSVRLTNKMMEGTGITENDLYVIALKNLGNEVKVCNIEDCISSLERGPEGRVNMLILTNEDMQFGAAAILSKRTWEKAAKMYSGNFYLLPSSVHEYLAVPDRSGCGNGGKEPSIQEYHNMVKEVNDTVLEQEEILTYSVYYYDRDSGEISVLADGE